MDHPGARWLVGVVLALGCTRDGPKSDGREHAAVSSADPVAAAAPPPPGSPSPAAAADPAVFVAPLFGSDVGVDTLPLSLGIETLGGVNAPIVARGTALPYARTEVFSTAVDNQPAVEITVTLGEHAMARDNRIVGRLRLGGIMPAPRGVPQIEVSFELDAAGTLTIRARDRATQRPSPVTSATKAPAPLTTAEIAELARGAAPTGGHEATKTPLFGADVAVDTLPLSLGIETLRGENTIVLARGTALPATISELFSTAADNQASVEVHVVQGERALAADNRTLGKFRLTGIPPAPRGVPQIELILTVSADGTFVARARDNATGRTQAVESVGGCGPG